MALNKKKSRPITVDGEGYRWQFFENSGWNDVTIQSATGQGQKLIVQTASWTLESPRELPPVTPSLVEHFITEARKLGWIRTANGPELNAGWVDGKLVVYSSN